MTYDAGTGVVKHLRRFRGVFALDTSAPTSSGAPAFPLDTYTLAFSVGLAPTLAKQVGAAVALLSPGTVAFAAASSRPPPLPLPGTQVGGGYTVLEARNVSAMAATTGGGASQRQRVLAEVEVWRGVGGACLVLSGHAVALASGLLGFLLSPTHFQTRTRRSLLSPTIGFRFLVAAGAVPLALCHLRQAHTLLAAGREGGRGVPATLADYVGALTLGFVLMNLVVASVCAGLLYHLVTPDAATRYRYAYTHMYVCMYVCMYACMYLSVYVSIHMHIGLLYHLVTPDAATRRAQDFNRRIIVLVSIYTHTHTYVYIYMYRRARVHHRPPRAHRRPSLLPGSGAIPRLVPHGPPAPARRRRRWWWWRARLRGRKHARSHHRIAGAPVRVTGGCGGNGSARRARVPRGKESRSPPAVRAV